MKNISFTLLIFFALCLSCKDSKTGHITAGRYSPIAPPEVVMPVGIEHVWDGVDFSDLSLVRKADDTEQVFSSYAAMLHQLPVDRAQEELCATLHLASQREEVLQHFVGLCEKYFYNPNSYACNEELYAAVLDTIFVNRLSAEARDRCCMQRQLVLQNRLGQQANDIRFILSDGHQGSLYGISSPYTLVVFTDPSQSQCDGLMNDLKSSNLLSTLQAEGKLQVLCLCPYSDVEGWGSSCKQYPESWLHAYDHDQAVVKKQQYDLKVLPSMYLLSSVKQVVAKNIMAVNTLEQTLSKHIVEGSSTEVQPTLIAEN